MNFVYIVEARMRANTQRTRGAGAKRGGRGKDKTVGKRDIMRSEEGRGMGRDTRGIQDGHHRDFQDLTRQALMQRNTCKPKLSKKMRHLIIVNHNGKIFGKCLKKNRKM